MYLCLTSRAKQKEPASASITENTKTKLRHESGRGSELIQSDGEPRQIHGMHAIKIKCGRIHALRGKPTNSDSPTSAGWSESIVSRKNTDFPSNNLKDCAKHREIAVLSATWHSWKPDTLTLTTSTRRDAYEHYYAAPAIEPSECSTMTRAFVARPLSI